MKSIKRTHEFKALELKLNENSVSPHVIYFKEHSVREHTNDKPSGRTLFVVNVPPYADEKGLMNAFSAAGTVQSVIFSTKPNTTSTEINLNKFLIEPQKPSFKVCYLVFKKVSELDKALKLTQLNPMNTNDHEIKVGMKKWIEEYNNSIENPKVIKERIETFMKNHDKKTELEEKQDKELEQEDGEGWVTVTKKSKVQSFARTEKVENKIMAKEEKNKKRKELKNFYTFQIRESKMKHIVALRQKFEEDKKKIGHILPSKWIGHSIGFRSSVHPKTPPPGREDTLNVLILGFDSTSKNGFIRRMPKSYKILTEKLEVTVLNGYNIVGDGTPAALFPILTGKTELELPDVRRKMNNATLDSMPFIFYKLKDDGYRTAYFEDMPWIGTFQYRFNGFQRQPADHYLRAFYLEESHSGRKWSSNKIKYCVGDTPQYKLMLNITDQFLRLDGKRFCFTFIADITHDDFNMISTADDDTADFLNNFLREGMGEDTLLLVMGDHGPRYAKVRDTLQGKLEERLPLMAIRLPDVLTRSKPKAQENLENNADVLTTPHDIYATVLDVLELRRHWNPYKVSGADLTRGLSLLEPISANRSCSEAGIEPHWCTCLSWQPVPATEPRYTAAARALLEHINSLTEPMRSKCVPRTLNSVSWVMKQLANNGVLTFVAAKDTDGYVGKFGARVKQERENYQVKIEVGPGHGIYEASMAYVVKADKFEINTRDISRTNAYNNEPSCISATHPHLNMYCYCVEQ